MAGINLSATLTAALGAERRKYAARKWQDNNREALDALNHDEHWTLVRTLSTEFCEAAQYRTQIKSRNKFPF